jgi:hypothetical protein
MRGKIRNLELPPSAALVFMEHKAENHDSCNSRAHDQIRMIIALTAPDQAIAGTVPQSPKIDNGLLPASVSKPSSFGTALFSTGFQGRLSFFLHQCWRAKLICIDLAAAETDPNSRCLQQHHPSPGEVFPPDFHPESAFDVQGLRQLLLTLAISSLDYVFSAWISKREMALRDASTRITGARIQAPNRKRQGPRPPSLKTMIVYAPIP